jgi:cobalt/nickel transport system ATP-binding protein
MDEPTSNLDPKARRQLIHLLKTFEHTIILATHDLDMVLDLCSRTIILKKGRVEADGSTRDILQNQELLDACRLEKPLQLQSRPICSSGYTMQ